ncbi:DUF2071 domain-containing protein [Lewinella sp. W8]|uniref:YqjF family protein n=1 Tax=Lewinella sp. W8 TaxID=2528208 RepID=UPI001067AE00|nr:DUF2071 domain-containing protein [Lewinella sp. W8]
MKTTEILKDAAHRPWPIPAGGWQYYQEWNDALFLHWKVAEEDLRRFVPAELEIDLWEGSPWVSLVAFTMERIRPKLLPAFPPVSDFPEINIRTYVKYRGKQGVYFLSIEGGKPLSCWIARSLSELPYRYSAMTREPGTYTSHNAVFGDCFSARYRVLQPLRTKTPHDLWLTERYALFQETARSINAFDIHHQEWPVSDLLLDEVEVDYPRFASLLSGPPELARYSPGVQVLAWGKVPHARILAR